MMFDMTRGEAHVGAGLMSVVITSTPISHLHINGRARAGTIDCFITRLNTCHMSELVYRRLHVRLMGLVIETRKYTNPLVKGRVRWMPMRVKV